MSALTDRNVLIVEDDAVVAIDLANLFRAQGATVLGPAASVASALSYIQTATIDCAVLDVNLREEDCSPVADLLAHADIPFVFVTAFDGHDVLSRHPSQPVVKKPFNQRDIISATTEALAAA